MKKIGAIVLAAGLVLAGCGNGGTSSSGNYATVNGKPITQKEFDSELDMYMGIYAAQLGLKDQVGQMLIQDAVIKEDLSKVNIEVTDTEVNSELDAYKKSIGGEQAYADLLKANNLTDDQYKETIRKQSLYSKHKTWYNENHPVTDEQIQEYFEANKDTLVQVQASHILVETKEEADAVIARLNNGEDFAEIAKEVSKDGSAAAGGDLGYFAKGRMVENFENAAFSMNVGDISEPVETEHGFHVIKLTGKQDTAEALKATITTAVQDQNYSNYTADLVANAKVEYPESKTTESTTSETTTEESQSTTSEEETTSK